METGIRELRDGLSRHLATVRSGRTVTVTDHGRPVARIVPVDTPSPLERLVAEGRIRPAPAPRRAAPVELSGPDLVAAAGDRRLPDAWHVSGSATYDVDG